MPRAGTVARYEVRAHFRAPLEFVFRWCTDYTTKDSRYEGEKYTRRILRRSPREVVYEDLEDMDGGWYWTRHIVRLRPPNRWHSESVGSHRAISLEYRLSRLPGDRTELILTARRRPAGVGSKNPPRAEWEKSIGASWRHFGRALERDYRRSVAPRSPR